MHADFVSFRLWASRNLAKPEPSQSNEIIRIGTKSDSTKDEVAHLLILSFWTPFFANALRPPFVEYKERRILFEGHNRWTIYRLVFFAYVAEYKAGNITGQTCGCYSRLGYSERTEVACNDHDVPLLLRDVEVYRLADMIDIPELKSYASESLRLRLANVKLHLPQHIASFAECVSSIYNSTTERDKQIRELVVDKVIKCKNIENLWTQKRFLDMVIDSGMGHFATDLARAATVEYAAISRGQKRKRTAKD